MGFPQSHYSALHASTHASGGADAVPNIVTGGQAAIADLNLGVLTLLTDTITALGTVQTKLNTLLAELRTAGVIAP